MKKLFFCHLLFLVTSAAWSQNSNSPLDMLGYGLVLDDPAMKSVRVKQDVTYLEDAKGSLHIDIYTPASLKPGEKDPPLFF